MPQKAIGGRWRRIDAPEWEPLWLLMRVLQQELDPDLGYSVRQNVWPEEAKITFARSATKHRISRQRSLHVIERCGFQLVKHHAGPMKPDVDQRVVFLGDDLEGVALEVFAAERSEEEFLGSPRDEPEGTLERVL